MIVTTLCFDVFYLVISNKNDVEGFMVVTRKRLENAVFISDFICNSHNEFYLLCAHLNNWAIHIRLLLDTT